MMNSLEFFGHALYFILGMGLGTAIMYFGPLIVEWIDTLQEDDKNE